MNSPADPVARGARAAAQRLAPESSPSLVADRGEKHTPRSVPTYQS